MAYEGAHVLSENEHNLGVMVLGNFERQRMSQRRRARIGYSGHLPHPGDVGITAIALNTVGHVEHHSARKASGGVRPVTSRPR